jgi:hypothetical protein
MDFVLTRCFLVTELHRCDNSLVSLSQPVDESSPVHQELVGLRRMIVKNAKCDEYQ